MPQTRANEAAVEHTVTVADLPLQVTLTADPPTAVEEGGGITLTAAANRAVLAGEDATVRLTVVGPVVEPAPSSVTIAVGTTSAAAVLTVEDDDEVKDLGDVTVIATGGSLATDPTRLDVTVTENDAATVHTYTFTATAIRVTEGGEVQLVVTAAPAVEEETVVSLTASPRSLAGDFTLEPPAITLAAGGEPLPPAQLAPTVPAFVERDRHLAGAQRAAHHQLEGRSCSRRAAVSRGRAGRAGRPRRTPPSGPSRSPAAPPTGWRCAS